jgi:hypothetical protein
VVRLVAMKETGETFIFRDESGDLRQRTVEGRIERVDNDTLLSAITKYDWLLVEESCKTFTRLKRRCMEIAESH